LKLFLVWFIIEFSRKFIKSFEEPGARFEINCESKWQRKKPPLPPEVAAAAVSCALPGSPLQLSDSLSF
jgi:hypothetical protein